MMNEIKLNLTTLLRIFLRRKLPIFIISLVRAKRNNYEKAIKVKITDSGFNDKFSFIEFQKIKYYSYLTNQADRYYYKKNITKILKYNEHLKIESFGTLLNFYKRYYVPSLNITEITKYSYPEKLDGSIFEIGSYLGLHAAFLAKRYKSNLIYAFEASFENYSIANQTLNQFKNCIHINCAIGNKTGNFFFSREKEQLGSLVKNSFGLNGSGENVNVISLDEYIIQNNIKKVGLLRIQVNGFEKNVIHGAIKTIKRDFPILVLTSKYIDKNKTDNLINFLINLGYLFKKFDSTFVGFKN